MTSYLDTKSYYYLIYVISMWQKEAIQEYN